ncbi:hypothetical protein P7H20_20140 [Paenibacillus larvae]|nr:hypothetical protein [Paenibacillus larvae]MDT2276668.1 hypothetical protein [Paenibacillus larvae]
MLSQGNWGQSITIQRKTGMKVVDKLTRNLFASKLKAEVIEGDTIYLENTKADIVRGNRIVIGQGCEIRLIEFKEHFEADKSAKIGNSTRL